MTAALRNSFEEAFSIIVSLDARSDIDIALVFILHLYHAWLTCLGRRIGKALPATLAAANSQKVIPPGVLHISKSFGAWLADIP
jgi:hypothetical protein